MSQCGLSSCGVTPQTGGACPCQSRNTLKGGACPCELGGIFKGGSRKRSNRRNKTSKKKVRFNKYAIVCNCKSRTHRRKHKKLPKNCTK